jgi:hypothetical protein
MDFGLSGFTWNAKSAPTRFKFSDALFCFRVFAFCSEVPFYVKTPTRVKHL